MASEVTFANLWEREGHELDKHLSSGRGLERTNPYSGSSSKIKINPPGLAKLHKKALIPVRTMQELQLHLLSSPGSNIL